MFRLVLEVPQCENSRDTEDTYPLFDTRFVAIELRTHDYTVLLSSLLLLAVRTRWDRSCWVGLNISIFNVALSCVLCWGRVTFFTPKHPAPTHLPISLTLDEFSHSMDAKSYQSSQRAHPLHPLLPPHVLIHASHSLFSRLRVYKRICGSKRSKYPSVQSIFNNIISRGCVFYLGCMHRVSVGFGISTFNVPVSWVLCWGRVTFFTKKHSTPTPTSILHQGCC